MDFPEFKLYYHCSNNGDGCVSVHLHQSEMDAIEAENDMKLPWKEYSIGEINLKIIGGALHYETYDDKYNTVWKEVERVG